MVGSEWNGTFCFQNQLGKDIIKGTARHWTTDYGTEIIDLAGLVNGATSSSIKFKTSTGNKDRWAFAVECADNSTYAVTEKDCGYETEDAGQPVTLHAVIAGSDRTFYVSMPKTSSCSTSF